ncbi:MULTISPECIES: hypothetical protein [Xanthomonas]|uniref:Uncharacterized protein n=1 Tax=Xanthomonas euvesicatoria TaxID=456327 RepID=A0AAX4FQP9_XANEU|nr:MULTISPECIES: hypothetical protein [Xanthomonas]QYF47549.1 hypothetical protein HZS93_07107 [Xanthomonas citri]WOP50350.1 hypothetical protein R2B60_21975 [Xanthomonas euvesicatoria]WOP54522.1 hypothetical protein R5576_21850 [Xanthomonas euvesicatoria]WOP58982.1 hypothetical protein R5577_22080 [Xanthomonas euvesicatoria]
MSAPIETDFEGMPTTAALDAILREALALAGSRGLRVSDLLTRSPLRQFVLKHKAQPFAAQGEPPVTRVKRHLQAMRASGAAHVDAGCWTLTQAPQHRQLYQLVVTTYQPDKYVLLNTVDGSAWRGDVTTPGIAHARWLRAADGAVGAVHILRQALEGLLEHSDPDNCPNTKAPDRRNSDCAVCHAMHILGSSVHV